MSGAISWVPSNSSEAPSTLACRAVVGGHEAGTGGPLWVIRAQFEGELIPGKLAVNRHEAYIPWGGKEKLVQEIEVCCASPESIKWVVAESSQVPPNAVVGGYTSSKEKLYIGRVMKDGSVTPGKVQSSHNAMYISYDGHEIPYKNCQILCTV